MKRWHAVVWYLSDNGPIDVHHDFEELDELHDLIERGPTWEALDRIEIKYARDIPKITVEQAAKL